MACKAPSASQVFLNIARSSCRTPQTSLPRSQEVSRARRLRSNVFSPQPRSSTFSKRIRYYSSSVPRQSSASSDPYVTPINPEHEAKTAATAQASEEPKSSAIVGTPLKGLGYLKAKGDPLALEDREYPDWLWDCLKPAGGAEAAGEGLGAEMFSKSKKERRKAAKALRKRGLDVSNMTPAIPIHHQSIDLPSNQEGTAEGAIAAAASRADVTKEMRKARRKSIKEKNFLKTMS